MTAVCILGIPAGRIHLTHLHHQCIIHAMFVFATSTLKTLPSSWPVSQVTVSSPSASTLVWHGHELGDFRSQPARKERGCYYWQSAIGKMVDINQDNESCMAIMFWNSLNINQWPPIGLSTLSLLHLDRNGGPQGHQLVQPWFAMRQLELTSLKESYLSSSSSPVLKSDDITE